MHASVQSHEYIPSDSVDMWAMAILIYIKFLMYVDCKFRVFILINGILCLNVKTNRISAQEKNNKNRNKNKNKGVGNEC